MAHTNVDVLDTDWTAWQDMSRRAQDYIVTNAIEQVAHEDDDGEPMVLYILPAGSMAALEEL